MSAPDQKTAEAALAKVIDPTFDKPMVEIGTLSGLKLSGSKATLDGRLSSPAEATRAEAEKRIGEALAEVGVDSVEVEWEIEVPTREVLGDDPMPGVKNILLVMSGKGGVGKSTCAVNLALALSKMGTRVGLLDADIYGPSIPTMMGIEGSPRSTDGKKIEPLQRFGIKLMSIGFLLEEPTQAIVWRGPMLHSALSQFMTDVDWGELDYLVLDLPPGTGDVALSLAQKLKVTGVVMVTTPQEVALQDVYKGVNMCRKLGLPLLGVVENMSYFIDTAGVKHELFGSGGGQKLAEFAESELLGQVPMETAVREWGDDGTPIVKAKPDAGAAKVLTEIADKLAKKMALAHFDGSAAPSGEGRKRLRILR